MKLSELQQALQAVNPAAVLVSPRVLERVIEQVHDLPALLWEVPHRKSCVVDRQVLFRHIEQEDLDLNPGQLLPSTVILLARPSAEFLNEDRAVVLVEFWRRLFHASVHHELERRWLTGELTPADVRARIEAIGPAAFEEARTVLHDDHYLTPAASEHQEYIEFAAVFLELHYFAANLLAVYFPAIRSPHRVKEVLGRDLDADLLFSRTRLPGAPDPVPLTDTRSDESHDFYYKLVRSAERAERSGNTVRGGILRMRAARVAPGNLTASARAEAEAAMQRLTHRLEAALELSPADGAEWARHLTELLDRADQGHRPVEADLLFDLQQICLDHEKDVYALNLIDWLLSAGKRPIRRPLPSQRLVRIGKHLQAARDKLTRARLSDVSRRRLDRLLESARQRSEERLRARLRPVLEAALEDVGLLPQTAPERVAFDKIIEELLDRITTHGFLTFGDLRDTLSRNQLKLPDITDPDGFLRGDPLLRLDRRLGALLDGVYRPSDVYMRGLERVTALNFGTKLGRVVTRFITLPFGCAFLLMETARVFLHLFLPGRAAPPVEVPPVAVPDVGEGPQVEAVEAVARAAADAHTAVADPHLIRGLADPLYWAGVAGLGVFVLLLMHWPWLRERCLRALSALGGALRFVFLELPGRFIRRETLERIYRSWTFQIFYRVLLAPTLLTGALCAAAPQFFLKSWAHTAGTFTAAVVISLSTLGQAAGEAFVQAAAWLADRLRADLLPSLVRFILYVFKRLVDGLEYVLFSVDEYLRFRSGDSRLLLAVRTVLAALWFPVSYVIRFYSLVLIEPMLNPVKLPLTILAAKLVYPLLAAAGWFEVTTLSSPLVDPLVPYLGRAPAWFLVVGTLYLLPDAVVFLFWEMKENWRLYRANRPKLLRPAVIGDHGETMRGLLAVGFHSGTVPKLYAKLRRAERLAARTGNWQNARYYRARLHRVEEAVRLFVTRNLVALVRQGTAWRGRGLTAGGVDLACSRVAVELVHEGYPEQPVWLEFELQAGWLLAGVARRGWLDELTEAERRPLNTGLASLYKLAGVDLVREQVRAALPAAARDYDLTTTALVAWVDHRQGRAVRYDLTARGDLLQPRLADGTLADDWPVLDARQVLYARVPLTWQQWVECWQKDQETGEHPPLIGPRGELVLLPPPAATAPDAAAAGSLPSPAAHDNGPALSSPPPEASLSPAVPGPP